MAVTDSIARKSDEKAEVFGSAARWIENTTSSAVSSP